jgi:hypothetical protein
MVTVEKRLSMYCFVRNDSLVAQAVIDSWLYFFVPVNFSFCYIFGINIAGGYWVQYLTPTQAPSAEYVMPLFG